MFIDAQVVKKRQHILIVCSFVVSSIFFLTAFVRLPVGAFSILMMIKGFALNVADTVFTSFIVQQCRKDMRYGMQNLQVFRMFCFGLGAFIGGGTGSVLNTYYSPFAMFIFFSFASFT